MSEEAKEEAYETLAAVENAALEKIMEMTLQITKSLFEGKLKMIACRSSLSLKVCIEPHNSKKYTIFCPFYVLTRVTSILTI